MIPTTVSLKFTFAGKNGDVHVSKTAMLKWVLKIDGVEGAEVYASRRQVLARALELTAVNPEQSPTA